MEPLITVIVPVYNVEKYLDKCVESIVNQTYKNLEIILVDDGSPDNCPAMCDEWAKKDSRIKVIHKANGGVSSARNAGLDTAQGEYIGFVDSDDYIKENMYEILLKSFCENNIELSVCGLVCYGKAVSIDKNKIIKKDDALTMLFDIKNYPYFEGYVWNKLFKSDIIKKNKLRFDENIDMSEDTLFNFMYLKYVSKVSIVKGECYQYNYRYDSVMRIKSSKINYDMVNLCDFFIENSVNEEIKELTVSWSFKYWINAIDTDIIFKNGNMYRKLATKRIKENKKYILCNDNNSYVEKIFAVSISYFPISYFLYKKIKLNKKSLTEG